MKDVVTLVLILILAISTLVNILRIDQGERRTREAIADLVDTQERALGLIGKSTEQRSVLADTLNKLAVESMVLRHQSESFDRVLSEELGKFRNAVKSAGIEVPGAWKKEVRNEQ